MSLHRTRRGKNVMKIAVCIKQVPVVSMLKFDKRDAARGARGGAQRGQPLRRAGTVARRATQGGAPS